MKTKNIFKIALAVLVGELALILLATLAQEVLFDGIRYNTSSMFDLFFGGLATFLAAVGAGYLARLVVKEPKYAVPIALSVIISIEMTYLIVTNKTGDPVWFDVLGGSSLIFGIWLGFFGINKLIVKRETITTQNT